MQESVIRCHFAQSGHCSLEMNFTKILGLKKNLKENYVPCCILRHIYKVRRMSSQRIFGIEPYQQYLEHKNKCGEFKCQHITFSGCRRSDCRYANGYLRTKCCGEVKELEYSPTRLNVSENNCSTKTKGRYCSFCSFTNTILYQSRRFQKNCWKILYST